MTQACDLACKHCRADATPRCHPNELTTEEAMAFLDDVRTFGTNQLLVLSGGDPLFRDDTLELVEYGLDIGLQVTMTPSGTRSLTADIVQTFASIGLRRLALSFDGASPETHDAFRQERGSFEQTIAAARAARENDLPLQVNTTVCAETVGELPDIAALVDTLDAVLWSVFFLVPVGRGTTLQSITPDRADRVMRWLADIDDRYSFAVKTTEAPQYRRITQQTTGIDHPTMPGAGIIAGDGFAFVSHTGEVYPSGFLPYSVGNVRETSIVELYRSAPLFTQLRDRDRLRGKCGACEFRNICGGSRSRAFATTGDPFASDLLCPYRPQDYQGPMPQASQPSD